MTWYNDYPEPFMQSAGLCQLAALAVLCASLRNVRVQQVLKAQSECSTGLRLIAIYSLRRLS